MDQDELEKRRQEYDKMLLPTEEQDAQERKWARDSDTRRDIRSLNLFIGVSLLVILAGLKICGIDPNSIPDTNTLLQKGFDALHGKKSERPPPPTGLKTFQPRSN